MNLNAALTVISEFQVMDNNSSFKAYSRRYALNAVIFQTLWICMNYPTEENNYLAEHVIDIRNSYRQLLLEDLLPNMQSDEQFARQLFPMVTSGNSPDSLP